MQENELATRIPQPSSIAFPDEDASKQKDVSTTLEGLQYVQRDVTMLGFHFLSIPALIFPYKIVSCPYSSVKISNSLYLVQDWSNSQLQWFLFPFLAIWEFGRVI